MSEYLPARECPVDLDWLKEPDNLADVLPEKARFFFIQAGFSGRSQNYLRASVAQRYVWIDVGREQ